jgi:hypothetical protein
MKITDIGLPRNLFPSLPKFASVEHITNNEIPLIKETLYRERKFNKYDELDRLGFNFKILQNVHQ